ncbi:serralysin family metalloprotease [Pseudomonas aeruginosa]|uniref:serralysin family metalloprotease n=1 Tax=Pseudomonas aeruginosa TaxID=287 RepID=UPI000D68C945|nr:serralysin family metalloprotease [Pseudomonas aeruginosa]
MATIYQSVGERLQAQGNSEAYGQFNEFLHLYDRGGDRVLNGKPSITVDEAAEKIAGNNAWRPSDGADKVNLTYAFRTSADADTFQRAGIDGFSEFSDDQKDQARLAVQSWADVANITLTEVAADASPNITFGNYSQGGSGDAFNLASTSGWPWDVQREVTSAQVWMGPTTQDPALGNYSRLALAHEFGHALGLGHPGAYDGALTSYENNAEYAEDTFGYSLMSYWSESNTNQDFSQRTTTVEEIDGSLYQVTRTTQGYGAAPMLDDIAAIQRVYGANTETRTGDTVYGFNSNTDRDFLTLDSASDRPIFAVWDAGGTDTLDFSGFTQDQKINLSEASFSSVGGMVGNVAIAQGATVENAIGGSGNDLLIGNAVSNELKGGAGNDVLFGGLGADKLWGGSGADTFLFSDAVQSTLTSTDQILDFTMGQDKIDLSALSAFATEGLGLNFVNSFSNQAGQALLSFDDVAGVSELSIDLTGDSLADFAVQLVGQASAADIVV